MRKILSLSLQKENVKDIKNLSKARGFSSVSSYIKNLVEDDKDIISEKEILKAVRESRKEYKKGKATKADSIADLL